MKYTVKKIEGSKIETIEGKIINLTDEQLIKICNIFLKTGSIIEQKNNSIYLFLNN